MTPLSDLIFASTLAVVEERMRQIERFGHDAEQDDGHPVATFFVPPTFAYSMPPIL